MPVPDIQELYKDFQGCDICGKVYPDDKLFPQIFRVGYYDYRTNKKEALQCFERFNGVRVIEKSMRTGQEKIIKERLTA